MTSSMHVSRRVVVSGIGLCTPLGDGCETNWSRLIRGDSGLRWLEEPHWNRYPGSENLPPGVRAGGPANEPTRNELSQTGEKVIALAIRAAAEAFNDARLAEDKTNPYRSGVVIGTSKGGLRSFEKFLKQGHELPDERAATLWQEFWSNTPAQMLAQRYQFLAAALCPVAACATGLVSIQRGAELIQQGLCDVVLAGSTDASLLPVLQGSFHRLGVLAKNFNNPESACRPFDRDREGFLIGEGAAVLVLEDAERAASRGVKPYAEWLGGGIVSDGTGLTQLEPNSPAMQHLLESLPALAGFEWGEVDYLNLHGTGTVMNDECEASALLSALGEHAERIPASSLKGTFGHLLGAAGSVETALTLLAWKHKQLPANHNLETPFTGCRLNLLRQPTLIDSPRVAVKLSLGFGGHLTAGCFKSLER